MTENKQQFSTTLAKVNDIYAPMIERQLTGNGIHMDGYAKQCVLNAISSINNALDIKGISWTDPQLDKSNITQTLLLVASLKLNAAASPREVYFQVRNVRVTAPNGKTEYKKQIEMGIEGDGNDAILARFGRDVEKVGQFWLVREGDEFEYPVYNGFDVTPPKWKPTGRGDVVRVVYPIKKKDGTIEYYIGERDDVAKNLLAHINNNLMNETFGIAESRYKATPKQLQEISAKKTEILRRAKELGLDALDDPELQQWISPAWTEFHSREQMIIRKMRNNVVKKIPKDFGNAFVEMSYHTAQDAEYAEVRREIAEHGNSEVIDIEATVHPEEAEKEPAEEPDQNHQSQEKEQPDVAPVEQQDQPTQEQQETAPNSPQQEQLEFITQEEPGF